MIVEAKVTREGKRYVISMPGLGVTQAISPERVSYMIQDYCASLNIDVEALKIDWSEVYADECCLLMAAHLYRHCHDHPDPFDCPDQLIVKSYPGPYGIVIHDGGHSLMEIDYCPWCGHVLKAGDFEVAFDEVVVEDLVRLYPAEAAEQLRMLGYVVKRPPVA